MKGLKSVYYFIVFSNLLIAGAAVAQSLLTYLILDQSINPWIIFIEGSATLLLYNFSLWLSLPKDPQKSVFKRTQWLFRNRIVFWVNSMLASLIILYSIFQIHWYSILFLLVIGGVSLLYSLPLFRFEGKKVGFRQVPGMKLFHIALVWSLSSVGLPVVELWTSGVTIDWYTANYLGVLKLLFLLTCTLPFDIRDMAQDSYYHLQTIPNMLGKARSQILSISLVIVHSAFVMISPYAMGIKGGLLFCNIIVLAVVLRLIFATKRHYHDVYLLDFCLILQFLLVFLFCR